jgi:hypothetical protein
MNHKPIIMASALGASILLATTECTMISPETAFADFTPSNQSVSVSYAMDIIDISIKGRSFERLSAEIVEVSPWLKDENISFQMSDRELVQLLEEVGFAGESLRYAWAIVVEESSKRPYAHNDNPSTGDNSYGLFQINMRGAMGPDRRERYGLRSNEDLFDPMVNAKIAYQMSDGGKNWSAWTTYGKAKKRISRFPW